ncbi:putative lysosomal alpha-glucosidase [Talaromyces proteolyticus]|uniref:Probable alpha/beta-glucosidase agdC n=1 Tax=Talaromyces proteolyticus TaxID=1131652 RepID=A0AAD4KNR5_9EURO|nr:putative lysosomal alpha-glucosidase [Talaromyces proteolyticus]KAH8695574.1 putative lysosomal alpha-glucosidase [Talaromyces proteolyticus]
MRQTYFFLGLVVAVSAASVDSCPGYTVGEIVQSRSSLTADLSLAGDACNVYGSDVSNLKLLVEYQTDSRLHVKIYDAEEQVYQIPASVLETPSGQHGSSSSASDLTFSYTTNPFSFAVQRRSNQDVLFNATGLVFESQYVRLRTSLPQNPNIYGLGEDSDSFRRETNDYTRTLWNRGAAFLPQHQSLYSSHPIYIEMRDGQAHGVFLSNSNGMDIKINQTELEGQYLEYNIIGGVLDFYFLSGPEPADVARQYAGVVGTPVEQSYWTYGFHQCKYGYEDVMMVAEVVYNYSQANIPLETMWTDIDYMDLRRTWTLDPERFPLHKMQELVTYLHDHQQQYIIMVDPPISLNDSASYDAGKEKDLYIKWANGTDFVGTMWPGPISYVDFFHPSSSDFWSGQIASFFSDESGVGVDGMWIDMNEPANFCQYPCANPIQAAINGNLPPPPPALRTSWDPLPGFPADFQPQSASKRGVKQDTGNMTGLTGRNFANPPYSISTGDGTLNAGSAWPELRVYGDYVLYDTHNLYASQMIAQSRQGLLDRRPNERPFIITRSSFAGDGAKTGKWTGDNASIWAHYLLSIVQHMEFASIFQIPMIGTDVCGFNDNTTETLCARWAMLGAWYPFYRNHADISANFQEFYRWPLVTIAARKAIATRFQLLDYFYTAFHQQTVDGSPTTIIPLFFQYPNDPNTLNINYQFFYGPSILVSPVTEESPSPTATETDSQSVTLYLPQDTFYDFWTGEKVIGTGSQITLDNITYTDIPVHVRGGSILPLRVDANQANTTAQLRTHDFELLIAPDANGKATGSLYLDDGISVNPSSYSEIEFSYDNGHLTVSGTFGFHTELQFVGAKVMGGNSIKGSNGYSPYTQLNKGLNEGWEARVNT